VLTTRVQTLQEVRHIIIFVMERAYASADAAARAAFRLETFAPYSMVKVWRSFRVIPS